MSRDFFDRRPAVRAARAIVLVLTSSLAIASPGRTAPADEAAAAAAKPAAGKCDRAKFRIILDVGHTRESYGALSARSVPEFEFNLNLARRIEERLKADGFAEAWLMITEGKARPSLMTRVARANKRGADLFLSIHHDSVPGIYNESWEFEGKKRAFNDLFAGYSVFVSKLNPHYRESLRFARLVGNEMASQDLVFARQYDQWFMGKYQRELLDHEAGVYRYDQLIVLKMTKMPAVLLESGSIINRDEEVKMASEEHKDKVATAVLDAVSEYCNTRGTAPPQVSQPQAKPAQARSSQAKPQASQRRPKPQAVTRAAAPKR